MTHPDIYRMLRIYNKTKTLYEKYQETDKKDVLKSLNQNLEYIDLEIRNKKLEDNLKELTNSRDRYFDLFEFAPIGYLTLSIDGLITQVNIAGEDLLGMSRDYLVLNSFVRFVTQDCKRQWNDFFCAAITGSASLIRNCHIKITSHNGTERNVIINSQREIRKLNNFQLRLTLTEITSQLKKDESESLDSLQLERREGVVVFGSDTSIIKTSEQFEAMTGYGANECVGLSLESLGCTVYAKEFFDNIWKNINEKGVWSGEFFCRRSTGGVFLSWLEITKVQRRNGLLDQYMGFLTDIELEKDTKRIYNYAFYDHLTHLPNRKLFLASLKHILMSEPKTKGFGAIIFIDLDNFKKLNDTHGQDKGDALLQQVAKRIKKLCGDNNLVARVGGDEFAVLVKSFKRSKDDASEHAHNQGTTILSELSSPYKIDDAIYTLTSSIGVTIFLNQTSSIEELLNVTDIAMYNSKVLGKNSVTVLEASLKEPVVV